MGRTGPGGGQILQTSASPLGEVKDVFRVGETCRFLLRRDILPAAGHMGLTREEPPDELGLLWTECLLSLST